MLFPCNQRRLCIQRDDLVLIEQKKPSLSILELNETRFKDNKNQQRIQSILNHDGINEETRNIFGKLLK